jgi:hypothetical protein
MQKILKNPVNHAVCETVDHEEILNQVQNDSCEDFADCHPCETVDRKEILNQVQNDSCEDFADCHPCETVDRKEILNQVQNDSCEDFADCHPCETVDHEEILNQVQNDNYVDLAVCHSRKLDDIKKTKISRKKAAFTLAETLIAIGIIGVVSALTIPTLIKSYQKRVIEVNLKKTYADIARVIRQSEADNGSFEGWYFNDWTTTANFDAFVKQYITPYMPMYSCKERAKGDECFVENVADRGYPNWRSGRTGEITTEGMHRIAPKYYTKDGRFWAIEPIYNTGRKNHTITFIVDVNGKSGKCVMGQDVFAITVIKYNNNAPNISMSLAGPYITTGWSDAYVQSQCLTKNHYGEYCGEWVKRNGWKFPKNYPFEIGTKSE